VIASPRTSSTSTVACRHRGGIGGFQGRLRRTSWVSGIMIPAAMAAARLETGLSTHESVPLEVILDQRHAQGKMQVCGECLEDFHSAAAQALG
jgi:hypothetical protein